MCNIRGGESFFSSCTVGPPHYSMKGGNYPLAHINPGCNSCSLNYEEGAHVDGHILPVQTVVGLKVGKYCISHEGAASQLLGLHSHSKQGEVKRTEIV